MTSLIIVIVNHNTREELEECLRSLNKNPPLVSYETIVVDNHSIDGSVETLIKRWPDVKLIQLNANIGFAKANNMAIRTSASDFILLLNSDTVVTAGAIDTMVRALHTHADVAIVGPRLVNERGTVEFSFGPMIGPFAQLKQILLRLGHQHGPLSLSIYLEKRTEQQQYPDWVSGACLLVRREDAESVGLLDEQFFMYCEDVDFCAAVRKLNRRVLFIPTAKILHLRGRTAKKNQVAIETVYRRSQINFYAKHHPHWLGLLRLYLWFRGKLPAEIHELHDVKDSGLRDT